MNFYKNLSQEARELKQCALYVANGIIVNYYDSNIVPCVNDVRNNFNMNLHGANSRVSDAEIQWMIDKVARFY